MEPAKIDWKNINSIFVEDERYEHINAPKWVDLSHPDQYVDDEAWFCRPDCKHPKTAEDFLKSTPSKLSSAAGHSPISPLRDQKRRDAKLKRRTARSSNSFNEASENQNPNLATPPIHQIKSMKSNIKSSAEKTTQIDDKSETDQPPILKSTLSARNLFSGRDILSHITELCSELKKLASRARERENADEVNVKMPQQELKKESAGEESVEVLGESEGNDKVKERKSLLEVGTEKMEGIEKSGAKSKPRLKKRVENAENVQISLNLENVRKTGDEGLMQIRTNPPTPQCFSASRGVLKSTPSKASRPRLMERGILQEMEQKHETDESDRTKGFSMIDEREARTLDVFWFLKPCTLSS